MFHGIKALRSELVVMGVIAVFAIGGCHGKPHRRVMRDRLLRGWWCAVVVIYFVALMSQLAHLV